MQAVLTNGSLAYDQRTVFDEGEQSLLNEPLRSQPFPVPGLWLEWRVTDDLSALPPASLPERALVAYQVERTQEERLAVQQQAEEVKRQQSELQRLMQGCLGVESKEVAFALRDSVYAVVGADEPPVYVVATVEDLSFRLAPYRVGPSPLQVGLRCPHCIDFRWATIHTLSDLGRVLHSASDADSDPDAVCPLCRRLAEISDDPFADQ